MYPSRDIIDGYDDIPQPDRPSLIVDHIVDEVAGSAGDLNGTPTLLSGVNTSLGVEHPLLAALNATQHLGAMEELPVEGVSVFGGINAEAPILQVVRTIGFTPLHEGIEPNSRDFADADQILSQTDLGTGTATAVTARGDVIDLRVVVEGDTLVLRAAAQDPAGRLLAVTSATSGNLDVFETVPMANGDLLIKADHWDGDVRVSLELDNGHSADLAVTLRADGETEKLALDAEEIDDGTFSAQAIRLAHSSDAETARLMQALTAGPM